MDLTTLAGLMGSDTATTLLPLAALLMVLVAMILARGMAKSYWVRVGAGYGIELVVLAFAAFALVALNLGGDGRIQPAALLFAIFPAVVHILLRVLRSRSLAVVTVTGASIALITVFYRMNSVEILSEIRTADTLGFYTNSILVSSWIIFPRALLLLIMSLLGGFYVVRRGFSFTRFFVGVVVAGYVSLLALYPFAMPNEALAAPWFFAIYGIIMLMLPQHRAAYERHLGIALSNTKPVAEPLPASASSQYFAHGALLLLAGAVALSAGLSFFERIQIRTVTNRQGVGKVWRSPALQNAYDVIEHHYSARPDVPAITSVSHPKDYDLALKLIEQTSQATRSEVLADTDRVTVWKDYLHKIGEYLDVLEMGAGADYLDPGYSGKSGQSVFFLNVREATRALMIRSQLALHDGNTTAALRDAQTGIRFALLFEDMPDAVSQMIGIALRRMAITNVYNLASAAQNDGAFLSECAALLEKHARRMQTGVDVRAIQHGEPAIMSGPVIPYVEMVVPRTGKMHTAALSCWNNFERLRLGIALERYRVERGAYPDEIGQLVPDYLTALPREPFEGRQYVYTPSADLTTYTLETFVAPMEGAEKFYAFDLPFSTAPDATLESRSGE